MKDICYKDFDVCHFMKIFRGNRDYDSRFNGFDGMIMESAEEADAIIEEIKKEIDSHNEPIFNLNFSYDDTNINDLDKKRIDDEIDKYCRIHNHKFGF